MSDRERLFQEVEKLVGSHALHGSESLCRLLQYLAKHAVENPGTPLKEYQIATELYGRPSDFDPQVDSTIRVQAGRLRAKLADYYATEGAQDPFIVELPRGAYLLSFHDRNSQDAKARPVIIPHHHEAEAVVERSSPHTRLVVQAIVVLALVAAAFFIGSSRKSAQVPNSAMASADPVPREF